MISEIKHDIGHFTCTHLYALYHKSPYSQTAFSDAFRRHDAHCKFASYVSILQVIWTVLSIAKLLKPLHPSDTMWWHRSEPTLGREMVCCLAAPSRYLTQCWITFSEFLWHSYGAISQKMLQISTTKINLKIAYIKLYSHLRWPDDSMLTFECRKQRIICI